MFNWYFFFVIVGAVQGADIGAKKESNWTSDIGNWTVGDCIRAQFALSMSIQDLKNFTDLNVTTLDISMPKDARADKNQENCGEQYQLLHISWFDESKNGTMLARNVSIKFELVNDTETNSMRYGVQRMYGYIELGKFEDDVRNQTVKVTSFLDIDTDDQTKMMFKVPVNYSYLCSDVGKMKWATKLHYTYSDWPDSGMDMKNATTISMTNVRFDAFRPKNAPILQTPIDCDYQPNDIVPIAVGVALATLVVVVLIAYIVGRRKRRQNGYLSV